MQNFAFSYKRCHGITHFFGFNVLVNAMLVVKVDVVGAQPQQRAFHRFSYRLRARVGNEWMITCLFGVIKLYAKLSGNHHSVAIGL